MHAPLFRYPTPGNRGTRGAVIAVGVTAGCLALLGITGCGGSDGGSAAIIPPTSVTVPVLWAGTNPDGTAAAGIEPAVVNVQSADEASFNVDLAGIQAKGAGEAWQLSSASAATVATLLTGADPGRVALDYEITAAIDGPSGGAALAIGTIAAIRGDALLPKVTMTGTIAPGGTIGRVGQVPDKVRAAAKAGYSLVLIPVGNERAFDARTGRPVDVVAQGRRLGVTVRSVRDVDEAYRAFTGMRISPPVAWPASLGRAAAVAARDTTRASLAAARRDLTRGRGAVPAPQRATLIALLASGDAAFARGDMAEAYGIAVDSGLLVARAVASGTMRDLARTKGAAAATAQLKDEFAALRALAVSEISRQSNPSGLTMEQRVTLPSALGWVVYAHAALEGMAPAIERVAPVELPDAAAILADHRVSIERFGPDAVSLVRASPARSAVDEATTAEFLNGYNTFLSRAGENARLYFEKVSGARATGELDDIQPALIALGREIDTSATPGDLQSEIVQAANAITYYVIGETLIGAVNRGTYGYGIGSDPVATPGDLQLADAVRRASRANDRWTAFLQWEGQNMSYPVWQGRWAMSVLTRLEGTPRVGAGAILARNEISYAVISDLVVRSASLNLR
jgi:hypothetical protein